MDYILSFHPIYYSIFYFFILFTSFLVGHFIYNLFSKSDNNYIFQIFVKLTIGILFFSFFTSVFFTAFNTVQLFFLVPIILLVKTTTIRIRYVHPRLSEFKILTIATLPILLIQYYLYSSFNIENLLPIDINNHAEIGFFMKQGFESKYTALNSLHAQNVPLRSPYHYFEIWYNTFVVTLFPNLKVGYSLLYITYPIFFTTYLIGIISLLKIFNFNKYVLFGLSILFLFFGPMDIHFFRHIFDVNHLFSTNVIVFENVGFFFNTLIFSYHGQKHIPFYLISILFIALLIKNNDSQAFTILSFAPIINIGLLPGLLGGILLFLSYKKIRGTSWRSIISRVYPLLLSIIFIFIYYKINGGYDIENQTKLNLMNSDLNLKGEIIKIIIKIVYCILFISLLFIVPILLLLFNRKPNEINSIKKLLIISLCVFVSGLITRPLIEGFNSPQFLSYLFPFFNIVFIFLISKKIASFRLFNKLILVICVITYCIVNVFATNFHVTTRREISINYSHSKSFTDSTFLLLHKSTNKRIGYFLSKNDFETISPGFWYGYYPCEFLLTKDYFAFYSLNFPNFKYPDNSSKSNEFSPNHLRYMLPKKITFTQYKKMLPSFIRKNKIAFLVAKQDSELPITIDTMIRYRIVDEKSGDVFMKLKLY